MSNLTKFAEYELNRAGLFDEDSDYGGRLGKAILRMIKNFSSEGHSGGSASIALLAFGKLARWEPLTPLTGEDDEWNDVSDAFGGLPVWQNRRSPRVLKTLYGAYDLDGKVFRRPDGTTFTSSDSRVPVTFPYTPTTVFVDVEGDDQ